MTDTEGLALQNRIDNLEVENQFLRRKIDYLTRRFFGGKKSEQIDPSQLELLLAGLEEAAAKDSEEEKPDLREKQEAVRPKKPKRRKLPDHLEVEEIILIPEEAKANPEKWRLIGEEVTEELDLLPARFIKRRIIRKKYVSIERPKEAPVVEPMPSRVIDKGIPGVGLLVHILLSKYVDHLPLYRQEKIFRERYDVRLPRQSMLDWVQKVAEWLKPIYNYMRQQLFEGGYVQADETPIRYLEPDVGKQGGSRQGYMWVYGRPGAEVLFDWQRGRGVSCLESFLNGYEGLLQTDGYAAYPSFARERKGITLIGCLAHARRNFHEALEESPQRAGFILRLIQNLYRNERYLREQGAGPRLREAYRQSHSKPTMQLLGKALPILRKKALPRSRTGEAVDYMQNHWEVLCRYLDHGRVEIDNNIIENAIRPTAFGKKTGYLSAIPRRAGGVR